MAVRCRWRPFCAIILAVSGLSLDLRREKSAPVGLLFSRAWGLAGRGISGHDYVTGAGGPATVALSNAEKQARWRARRNELARTNPEVLEGELLQRAERFELLSEQERVALADRL